MAIEQHTTPLVQRLLWFVALWFLGVASVGAIAFILRLWLK